MEKYKQNDKLKGKLEEIDYFSKKKLLSESLKLKVEETIFIDEAYKLAILCCEDLKWKYVYLYNDKYVNAAIKIEVEFYLEKYE